MFKKASICTNQNYNLVITEKQGIESIIVLFGKRAY